MDILIFFFAAKNTFFIAILSLLIGFFLSIIMIIIYIYDIYILNTLVKIFINIIICLPEILIIFFVYFNISYLNSNLNFIQNYEFIAYISGIISLSLLYSSYAYKTLIGYLHSISISQWESGKCLGFKNIEIFKLIIFPQIFKKSLPGLYNNWQILLKDTALISLISVKEIMMEAKNMIIINNNPFLCYTLAAITYILITIFSNLCFKLIMIILKL